MSVRSQVEEIALDDIQCAIDNFNEQYGSKYDPIEFVDMKVQGDLKDLNRDDCKSFHFESSVAYGDDIFTCNYSYDIDGDEVILQTDLDEELKSKFCKNQKVSASSILAADDFEDSLSDSIDDLADNVEDFQDAVEEYDEDDVDIELNNNIENHYIAECESCHDIFISAVIESDQKIDHVTGICPICGKETNQYLKWVIKPADFSDEQELDDMNGGYIENEDNENFEAEE